MSERDKCKLPFPQINQSLENWAIHGNHMQLVIIANFKVSDFSFLKLKKKTNSHDLELNT